MKNLLVIILALLSISCNAQIISLESFAQCSATSNCPNFNYIKDTNNSLDKNVGTWKGTYNGKTYELQFKKVLYEDFGIKSDILKGRMRIKDSNGNIIYDTFNEPDDTKTKFSGFGFQPNLKYYMMHFVGNSPFACGEMGYVYLGIKPETPNIMTIKMIQDADIVWGECPSSYQPTIPYTEFVSLTRQ